MQKVIEQAAAKDTTLTSYFKANQRFNTLYQNFPPDFVWNKSRHVWTARQRGFAIRRMYYAHPNAGERFYLCLLLTAVASATLFEHLCTVNGILQPTFKQACIELGLLENALNQRLSCVPLYLALLLCFSKVVPLHTTAAKFPSSSMKIPYTISKKIQ